ncbi:MAG TPA: hypothetical protein P5556_00850 [Candidatus Gastranaerophilales bacterium]|nr:hypothetical protein [Candidatus Gastranaerophilales bacterium]
MMTLTDKEKRNFEKFRAELTRISQKYGVAIKSIGGLMVGDIADIEYNDDPESGDLYPEILMWQEDVEEL